LPPEADFPELSQLSVRQRRAIRVKNPNTAVSILWRATVARRWHNSDGTPKLASRHPFRASATMSEQPPVQQSLIERIERTLLLLAYFIERDGDVHLAMFEKLETELEELKHRESAKTAHEGFCHRAAVPAT
jgi:hypothetical protein